MAELDKHRNRESWLTWAIEFMRRGLWLGPEVTVHGPHEYPSNYMWGEAEASVDGEKDSVGTVVFRTTRQAHKYHPRNVRIKDSERHYRSARIMDGKYDGATFPLKKESELTPKARKWLRVARAVLAEMQSKTNNQQRPAAQA